MVANALQYLPSESGIDLTLIESVRLIQYRNRIGSVTQNVGCRPHNKVLISDFPHSLLPSPSSTFLTPIFMQIK